MTSKKSSTPSKAFTPSHVEEDEDDKDDRPSWRDFDHLVNGFSATVDKVEYGFDGLVEQRILFQRQEKEAKTKLKADIDPPLQAALMAIATPKVKVPTLAGQDIKVTLASGTNVSVSGKEVSRVLLEEEKWPASKIEQFLAKVTTRSPYDYMKITPPKAPYQKKN